jgi:O-glycosyl hydrolase
VNARATTAVACATLFVAAAAITAAFGKAALSCLLVTTAAPAEVNVTVNAAVEHQVLDGFGQAEPSVLFHPRGPSLHGSLRTRAIEKAYHEVGINMGIIGSLLESPGDYSQRRNDNDDPFAINWNGFNPEYLKAAKRYLVDLAKPFGFSNYYLGAEAPNVRWASPWLAEIRRHDYNRFLDEVAEQVLANVTWWKENYGEELPYYQLGNEQLSGNRASINPDGSGFGPVDPVQQMVDITKRAGARLRAAGFLKTRFMVGTEETEEVSLHLAAAILSDPDARKYVGAVGYHSYPYNVGYSSVPFILRTSGEGHPSFDRIEVRNRLRDLGKRYNVRVWMTENSHAGNALSYEDFRARAIQVHDEFVYADASAYFCENAMWDLASHRLHFGNGDFQHTEGNAVLINNDTGAITITGIGYAIGHYARWIKPGAVRVEATSTDPLVQVTAFRDDGKKQIALVLINNAEDPRKVSVTTGSLPLAGDLTGEQSTEQHYWQPLRPFPPSAAAAFSITLPRTSVTSIVASWKPVEMPVPKAP